MNREQAIATAKVLRKGVHTYNTTTAERLEHKTIGEAKRHSRSLGRGVALKKEEQFPKLETAENK